MRVIPFIASTVVLGLARAQAPSSQQRDFEVLGLGSGDEVAANEYIFKGSEPAAFLDALQGVEKNQTLPQLQDRSAELVGRQQCNAGYGYCASKLFPGC